MISRDDSGMDSANPRRAVLIGSRQMHDDETTSIFDFSRFSRYSEAVRAHLHPDESASEADEFWASEFGDAVTAANDDVAPADGERDRPLGFDWKVDREAVARTGYVESGTKDDDRTMMSIMAQLVRAGRVGEWVSYSRSRDFYRAPGRYVGIPYVYERILRSVEVLLQLELIEEQRTKPGSHNRRQSRMRATQKLLDAFEGAVFKFEPAETIRLRDDEGRPAGYDETGKTISMRHEMDRINAYVRSSTVELPDEDVIRKGDLLIVDGAVVRTGPLFMYRSFCRSKFSCGGRIYWFGQNLPSSRRRHLLLDGKPVFEYDFKAMHIDMLHARRGVKLEHDPYDIPGVVRKHAKLALLVVINARTRRQAICALLHAKFKDGSAWPHDFAATSNLLDRIIERNPVIADDVCSDKGVRLMHEDSEIAIRIIKACMRKGFVCLPVHDSFIVQLDHKAELIAIATAEMERYRTRVAPAKKQVVTSGNIERNLVSIPTEGDGTVPPSPAPAAPVLVAYLPVDLSDLSQPLLPIRVDGRGRPLYDVSLSARRQAAWKEARKVDPDAEYFPVLGESESATWIFDGADWRRQKRIRYNEAVSALGRYTYIPPMSDAERAANRRLPIEEGGSGWGLKKAAA